MFNVSVTRDAQPCIGVASIWCQPRMSLALNKISGNKHGPVVETYSIKQTDASTTYVIWEIIDGSNRLFWGYHNNTQEYTGVYCEWLYWCVKAFTTAIQHWTWFE